MRHFAMKSTKGRSRGFTLIASLMLMLLMSAVAVGLLMMVNTESRVGNSDLENNAAYHSAEGAMEKMAADLNGMYASILAPQVGDIQNLSSLAPNNDPIGDPIRSIRSLRTPKSTPTEMWAPTPVGAGLRPAPIRTSTRKYYKSTSKRRQSVGWATRSA